MAVSQDGLFTEGGRRRAEEEVTREDGVGAGREQPESPNEKRGDIFRVPRASGRGQPPGAELQPGLPQGTEEKAGGEQTKRSRGAARGSSVGPGRGAQGV